MTKLFATDLDGTLVNVNEISKENLEAVKNFKSMKNCFAVATGRPFNGVKYLIDGYDLDVDYFILLNGALILDKELKEVKKEVIRFETVEKIFNSYKDKGFNISVESGYETFIFSKEFINLPYPNLNLINDLNETKNKSLSLISMYYLNEDLEFVDQCVKEINNKFKGELVAYRNLKYIDIVPFGCSKGEGVKYIRDIEDILEREVYTIGDSWNDITMFEASYNSFTFNHAERGLHKHVKNLVDSVDECILKYVLSNNC